MRVEQGGASPERVAPVCHLLSGRLLPEELACAERELLVLG